MLFAQQRLLLLKLLCTAGDLLIERDHLFAQQRLQLLLFGQRAFTCLLCGLIVAFTLLQRRLCLLLLLL